VRIVYLHQYYVTPDMPGGIRSYELSRRLAERGHEVHVITTDTKAARPGTTWRITDERGVHVHWLPVPYRNAMSYRRRLWSFLQFALGSTVRAVKLRPDVVLATSTPLTVAFPGVIASRIRRARFVFEVRDLWPEVPIEIGALTHPVARRLAFALARIAYRNASHVIALSPGMADGVAAHAVPRERITVVPNGCDLELFDVPAADGQRFRESQPWLGSRPLVLYAGTFGAVNGLEYLVRVAAALRSRDPEVRFLLVGDGRTFEPVRRLAAELGVLDQNLFLMKGVPKSSMPAILSATTISTSLFLPLRGMQDNSANKFFDALAAGRPIAVNYGGWHAELLADHGAGIQLDTDPEHAAEQLAKVIRDDAWLAAAATASRQLARQGFARDLLFDRFVSVLLGPPAGPAPAVHTGPAAARPGRRPSSGNSTR
jgi:glycosyltransferase involved in cell wall biosynthesis